MILLEVSNRNPTLTAWGEDGKLWLMKLREELTHPTVGVSGMFKYLNVTQEFSLHLSFPLLYVSFIPTH